MLYNRSEIQLKINLNWSELPGKKENRMKRTEKYSRKAPQKKKKERIEKRRKNEKVDFCNV